MKIGIIGAGRVGTSIGRYIKDRVSKHIVSGFYSRTYNEAIKSANFCNTEAFDRLQDLIKSSDTLFITVTDSEIKNVWDCIDKDLVNNKIICHFSGALSSDVFTGADDYGVYTGSIHPVYAFSSKFDSYKGLNKAVFTAEGDNVFLQNIPCLFSEIGNKVCVIKKEKKPFYHAGASMASNHLVALLHTVIEMFKECGFSEPDAYTVLAPLMMDNLNNALKNGVNQALTGPIERGDVTTIEKHLSVISDEQKKTYKSLGIQVLSIAENKNKSNEILAEKYRCIERMLLE
ncbi:MAG: DUF2520 domain-containing protein [Acutalibacteraceae bacterium]|nr:DUF2520 domain-containing protein [Acutalibacteraceae bacterium]